MFPGGEVYIKIDQKEDNRFRSFRIESLIRGSNDIMELLMLTDAVRREFGPDISIDLVMPYLPYARQDRVCREGESLSIKVFCDLINSQNYTSVEIWDVHSDVGMALLNNANNIDQWRFVKKVSIGIDEKDFYLVQPDCGAEKKTIKCSIEIGKKIAISSSKTRDSEGNVSGTTLSLMHEIEEEDNLLIIDDICDGGKTFIEIAKEIRKITNANLFLYTTHGIYSKGIQPLLKYYKHIFTANPFADAVNADYVTIVKY